MSAATQQVSGPPYAPTVAQLGGMPSNKVDTPISAVLLVFFVAAAATNMTIFQINRRRDHKFIMSAMTFGFCMARIVALTLRIVLANRLTNISLAIAASIFTLAGVIVLFIINLIFSQRIIRAHRPQFGWNKGVSWVFRFLFFSVPAVLIMMIIATVYSFYTLKVLPHQQIRKIQLFGSTYFAVLAFLPLPIVIGTLLFVPHQGAVERFGKKGRPQTQIRLLLFTATLLTLGASFRAGTSYLPRPRSDPAWYHHKACYYCFNFVIEAIVVYTYTLSRFDLRFHIPNGASAPGHYSAGSSDSVASTLAMDEADPVPGEDGNGLQRKPSVLDRINTENEAFGYEPRPSNHGSDSMKEKTRSWERRAHNELKSRESGEAV